MTQLLRPGKVNVYPIKPYIENNIKMETIVEGGLKIFVIKHSPLNIVKILEI